jgi:ATP-dependent RNA helicase DeaD
MTFDSFDLDPKILQALKSMGYEKPSPVQEKALPLILSGKDLIALAETGSGKTAACAIPLSNKVDTTRKDIQALIVVPTRELAIQYATETQRIGQKKGVKAYALYGGDDATIQMAKLNAGVQILVATPGRLIDLVHRRMIDLQHVETLVLDEADEMLSMGFIDDLEFIIQCLIQEHQTLLFSATMPKDIKKIASHYMKAPEEIVLQSKEASPETIDHRFVFVKSPVARPKVLLDLIREMAPKQSLIFCESRHQTEDVCRALRRDLQSVDFLHGGLSQPSRSSLTAKFRSGKIRHMVATDVAARGLDFSGVTHVFIYQLGRNIDTYVHRSGRTGRSGREGVSVTLITHRELELLDQVSKRIKRDPDWIGEPPSKRAPRR